MSDRLPHRFCTRCGHVSETVFESCLHASRCDGEPYSPWNCWACGAENWKTLTCRACGWERPEKRQERADA